MALFANFSQGLSLAWASTMYVFQYPRMLWLSFVPHALNVITIFLMLNMILFHTNLLSMLYDMEGHHKAMIKFHGVLPTSIFALFFMLAAIRIVSVFFTASLQWYAQETFNGRVPSLKECLNIARSHFFALLIWAFAGSFVNGLSNRSRKSGFSVISTVTQTAWAFLTLFVIPCLIFENKNLWDSAKTSYNLVTENFGQSSGGLIGLKLLKMFFGKVIFFLLLPGIGMFISLFVSLQSAPTGSITTGTIYWYIIVGYILLAIPLLIVGPIMRAAKNVFIVALYNKTYNKNTGPFQKFIA